MSRKTQQIAATKFVKLKTSRRQYPLLHSKPDDDQFSTVVYVFLVLLGKSVMHIFGYLSGESDSLLGLLILVQGNWNLS